MESASGRHSGENESHALTPPLSCTGTPEELDAELGRELAGGVEWRQALDGTLAAANAEMDAAAKAVQEEARKKAEQWKKKQAQTCAFEVCRLTGLLRHGAPTQAAQISTPWQWSRVNEYCGMSAAQPMRRCGLTIASLPLDSKARI
jgi:PRTRC genetic system protein E